MNIPSEGTPFTQDYFNWNGILIRQSESVHKIGTDALLLGSWTPTIISQASTILDVGTGTGVLALWMAKNYPAATIYAIDINPKAIDLAQFNMDRTIYADRLRAGQEDLLEESGKVFQYDLVICNPPYHLQQIYPREEFKRVAKHISSTIGEWMQSLVLRLTQDGHLLLIVPYQSAAAWIESANTSGLHNVNRLDVFSFEQHHAPKRSLLHLTSHLAKPHFSRLVIYNEDRTYTSEYLQFTGIGQ